MLTSLREIDKKLNKKVWRNTQEAEEAPLLRV